ncbi:MAG: tol-pal system-associated acyl-CoA thioesterase [Pseudomonadota bacterium]
MAEFVWPVRVYYEDTDSGGVVYYANYLKFMERARTEYLRHLGFEQDRMRAEDGVIFAVHSLSVEYARPARFNDALEVSARVSSLAKASVVFEQSIRKTGEDAVLCRGEVRIACLDAERFRPKAIPAQLYAEMLNEC